MIDVLLVQQIASAVNLSLPLLIAQIQVESSGDPFALRFEAAYFDRYIRHNPQALGFRYGALAACSFGLLQIMLETALEDGFTGRPEDLFVERVGLMWGAKHMRGCLDWAGGEYPKALAAYNGGRGAAMKTPWPNQSYVDKVLAAVS